MMVTGCKDVVLVQVFQFLHIPKIVVIEPKLDCPDVVDLCILVRHITQRTLSIFSWHRLSKVPKNVPRQEALTS